MSITYNTKTVTSGLKLHFDGANEKCYSGTGTTVYNLIFDGNNAVTDQNALSNVVYNSNGYWTFNTPDDITADAFELTAITCECWCRPTSIQSTDDSGRLIARDRSDYWMLGVYGNGGTENIIEWSVEELRTLSGASYPRITVNEWHHIIATFDIATDKMIVYYNGEEIYNVNRNYSRATIGNGSQRDYISIGQNNELGGSTGTVGFIGDIAVAKVYDRAITADEAKQNFNALRGRYGI